MQADLRLTWSEISKTGFLEIRHLINEQIQNKLASLRSQGWGTPLYINMEISWPSRHSLYDTQVNATNLSVTDKRSAHESCFNQ